MSCTGHYAELVAGRVLDSLEPGDDAELDAHLPTCADCRALLDELLTTASNLAHGVDEAAPPPELWDRIRAALPADAHRGPLPVDDLAARRRRAVLGPHRVTTRLAAGLVAAAVLGIGLFAVHVTSDRRHTQSQLAAEQSVLGHLQQPGAYSVTLRSGGAATGTAVVDGRTVDLVFKDLPRNDVSSTTYVLWASSPTHPTMVAVATFDVSTSAQTVVTATLPASVSAATAFGVTYEKGRTAPATPSSPVLGSTTTA